MAPQRFQTVVKKARFKVAGLSPQQMIAVGDDFIRGFRDRMARGLDVYDQPAPPLSMRYRETREKSGRLNFGPDRGYRAQKLNRGKAPIRDWNYSGITLRHLKVLTATNNKCTIGFIGAIHPYTARTKHPMTISQIVSINNRRHRQFGVSPRDRQNITASVLRQLSPAPASAKVA